MFSLSLSDPHTHTLFHVQVPDETRQRGAVQERGEAVRDLERSGLPARGRRIEVDGCGCCTVQFSTYISKVTK